MPASRHQHKCGHRGFGSPCHRCARANTLKARIQVLDAEILGFKPKAEVQAQMKANEKLIKDNEAAMEKCRQEYKRATDTAQNEIMDVMSTIDSHLYGLKVIQNQLHETLFDKSQKVAIKERARLHGEMTACAAVFRSRTAERNFKSGIDVKESDKPLGTIFDAPKVAAPAPAQTGL